MKSARAALATPRRSWWCTTLRKFPSWTVRCRDANRAEIEQLRDTRDASVPPMSIPIRATVLRWFWQAHDPTAGMGQGADRGTQYRSGVYYADQEQRLLIEASKEAYEEALRARGVKRRITTEVKSAATPPFFYFAEAYHRAPRGARHSSAQLTGCLRLTRSSPIVDRAVPRATKGATLLLRPASRRRTAAIRAVGARRPLASRAEAAAWLLAGAHGQHRVPR